MTGDFILNEWTLFILYFVHKGALCYFFYIFVLMKCGLKSFIIHSFLSIHFPFLNKPTIIYIRQELLCLFS